MHSSACLHFNKSSAGAARSVNIVQVIAVRAQFGFLVLDGKVTARSMHCRIVI